MDIFKKKEDKKPDDKKYEEVLSVILEFDKTYLKSVAESMGLNYEKIR